MTDKAPSPLPFAFAPAGWGACARCGAKVGSIGYRHRDGVVCYACVVDYVAGKWTVLGNKTCQPFTTCADVTRYLPTRFTADAVPIRATGRKRRDLVTRTR
jgi:hypothetical protein